MNMFYSTEEAIKIIELLSDLNIQESEEFVSIMEGYYNAFIVLEDNYIECYFSEKENGKVDTSVIKHEYRIVTYDIEKIINDKIYRISFDSYGILLFKLFVSYISGGISGAIFMSLESIVEYLMTSNVK